MRLPRLQPRTVPLLATCLVFGLLYGLGAVFFHDRGFASLYSFLNLFGDNAFAATGARVCPMRTDVTGSPG